VHTSLDACGGIFGPATVRALQDFQRNGGLAPDGVCGSDTVRMLELLRRQSGTGPGVASVRESMIVHTPLQALRIVVGQFGGLSSLTRSVTRRLRASGATVMSIDEYEPTAQAGAANRFGAHTYVGFEPRADAHSLVSFFAVPTFESVGGRALASKVAEHWNTTLLMPPEVRGMRLAVLRETRMPAVLCSLGPVRAAVDATDAITDTIANAVTAWAVEPSGSDGAR